MFNFIFKSSPFDLLSIIFSAISAVASAWTIYLMIQGNRPYIGFENFQIGYETNNTGPVLIILSLKNIGIRPLVKLKVKLSIFDMNCLEKVAGEIEETPNEITKDMHIHPKFIAPWNYKDKKIPAHYFIVKVSYSDVLLKMKYNQYIYMKWEGMENGVTKKINHISESEFSELNTHLNTKSTI